MPCNQSSHAIGILIMRSALFQADISIRADLIAKCTVTKIIAKKNDQEQQNAFSDIATGFSQLLTGFLRVAPAITLDQILRNGI